MISIVLPYDPVVVHDKDEYTIVLGVALKITAEDVRNGLMTIEVKDERARIVAIPFDPDRVTSVIEGPRGKEFMKIVLESSYDVYDADYALKKYDGKYVLIVHNDLLKDYLSYDSFEEEFFGVLRATMYIYDKLKESGFEPKLKFRSLDKIEKKEFGPEDLPIFL